MANKDKVKKKNKKKKESVKKALVTTASFRKAEKSSGAATARSGSSSPSNAPGARGQRTERKIPEPVSGKLARTGGKLPVDGTNKKGLATP